MKILWSICLQLLLLSHFSHVQLCATTEAAHQAPPSLGFSRQEHWSGLLFPSPMHESEKLKVKWLSRVQLLVTPWTAAHQAPLSMGVSRQEYRSGVPLPSPLVLYTTTFCHLSAWPLHPFLAKFFPVPKAYISGHIISIAFQTFILHCIILCRIVLYYG